MSNTIWITKPVDRAWYVNDRRAHSAGSHISHVRQGGAVLIEALVELPSKFKHKKCKHDLTLYIIQWISKDLRVINVIGG
jgi:hypothetical protein